MLFVSNYLCSAYELYASLPEITDEVPLPNDLNEDPGSNYQRENLNPEQEIHHLAGMFKRTFSRESVKVHFVGAWWVDQICCHHRY